MAKHKTKQKGGWPKRERESILLRVSPDLAAWLTKLAGESAVRSRSHLMERWLEGLRKAVDVLEEHDRGNLLPREAVELVGASILWELFQCGVRVPGASSAWLTYEADRKRMIEEVQAEKDNRDERKSDK